MMRNVRDRQHFHRFRINFSHDIYDERRAQQIRNRYGSEHFAFEILSCWGGADFSFSEIQRKPLNLFLLFFTVVNVRDDFKTFFISPLHEGFEVSTELARTVR
jgi:hypothetical protein